MSNNVAVTLRDIPRIGSLLDKAVTAGANSIHGVGFGHNDPSALLRYCARTVAVADARRKADIYDDRGGRKIGELMILTEEPSRNVDRPLFPRVFAADGALSDANRTG